jgi:preprotein translocase subunit SecY
VNIGRRRVLAVKPGYTLPARLVTATSKEHVKVRLDLTEQLASTSSALSVTATALATPESAKRYSTSTSSNTWLVTSAVATAAFAITTGVFAWQTVATKKDFDKQIDTFQSNRAPIEDARSTMKTYAYLTDAFAAATVISGGAALYLALTRGSSTAKRKESSNNRSVVLAPSLGGLELHGSW